MAEQHGHGGGGDAHGGGGGGGAHGGAGGEHKKHKKHAPHMPHEHEHEEGWIVSFADNVLLQMGFFVILLAMNIGPKSKGGSGDDSGTASTAQKNSMLDFAIAVRQEFHNPVRLDSSAPEDAPLIKRLKERQAQGETTTPGPDGQRHNVESIRDDGVVSKGGFVEFDDRSAELTDQTRKTIQELADQIVGTKWIIEVRGHSSKLETGRDVKAGMDLSYERASVVAAELVKLGVNPDQLRVVSCGVYDAVKPRASSAADYAANQRVEIIHTTRTKPADPYSSAAGQSGGSTSAGER